MPELRQNLATKEWVIIATERARRPEEFKTERPPSPVPPERKADCPFCPGNEKSTETAAFLLGGQENWKVRVIPNRYPALILNAPHDPPKRGLYRRLPGEGVHEVVIESPSHARHPARLEPRAMRDLISVYQERFKASLKNDRLALTLIFKNHGESAGTSLAHPHSQLVGSSVVPTSVRHRMDEAEKYHEQTGHCVFCAMLEEELRQGERILLDTPLFAAFILYAALSPFHIWILPKRHTASFGDAGKEELDGLAQALQTVLKKLDVGLGNPDYNYVIQSAPLDRGEAEPFHWYLSIVVKVHKTAGFELGSGMFINTSLPEESARFLNSVKA